MNVRHRCVVSAIVMLVLGALLAPTSVSGTPTNADVTLLFDVEAGPDSSNDEVFYLGVLGDAVVFSASDVTVGTEVWVTDGTTGGTELLLDINPGPADGSFSEFGPFGDQLVFRADDGVTGEELWITDGTSGGTRLVADINPGSGSSNPTSYALLGDKLVFRADDGTTGYELWITDGTEAGTEQIVDVNPSGGSNPYPLATLGSTLVFAADDGTSGYELWTTDGSEAGSQLLKDINPGSANSVSFGSAEFDGRLYFSADDGTSGYELWATDGTEAGTIQVADINPGVESSFPQRLEAGGDFLFFLASNDTNGTEPWTTDGTTAGTELLLDVNPGSEGSAAGGPVAGDGMVFFNATTAATGDELWVTDGTPAGTDIVRDIKPGAEGSMANPGVFVDGLLYFGADDGVHGQELWTTDGTEASTVLLKDTFPGVDSGYPSAFFDTPVGILFVANDGLTGAEPWIIRDLAGAPTAVTASTGDNLASTVSWMAPTDAGSGELSYTVTSSGGQQCQTTMLTCTVTGLAAGTEYTFTVVATSGFGDGPSSTSSSAITTARHPAADQIARLYQAAFGRAPDAAGLAYWVEQYQGGLSLQEIAAAFQGSPESTELYGSDLTDTDFIKALYANVLDRQPDDAGLAYWLGQLDAGISREAVLALFSESDENIERTGTSAPLTSAESKVLRLYRAAFGRAPDAAGLAYWTDQYEAGVSLEAIAGAFRDSSESVELYGTDQTDADFVDSLYQNVLGRPGDSAGLAYWTALLADGTTRSSVLVSFSESPENVETTGTAR